MEVSRPKRTRVLTVLAASFALAACGIATWTPTLHSVGEGPAVGGASDAYLKVHMSSGELYVLDRWTVPEDGQPLEGFGGRYDVRRVLQASGQHSIPIEGVALLETNRREDVNEFSIGGLAVFSTMAGITTVACLADPKSCFGSCPTFYSVDDPDRPVAEGFSASFARALEATDVDALGLVASSGPFSLVMRNEALETHAVRHARLLAVLVDSSDSTLQTTAGKLIRAERFRAPSACESVEGDCRAMVAAADDWEYAPRTNETDLATREEVILDFGDVSGEVGLVVRARNSFVTTYVFYQSLAYAGEQAGELLAALERGEPGAKDRVLGVSRVLGDIEVLISTQGSAWRPVGNFGEVGPIAADRQVIRLGALHSADLRVKLRMARGSWRIDEAALAWLGAEVTPIELTPDSVTSGHPADPAAWDRLMDPERHLVTVPGDEYRLFYTIPDGGDYELFLDTRGYYYEWVRNDWMAEESSTDVAAVLLQPGEALKRMAAGFKDIEPEMERLFWDSRFRR